MFSVPFLSSRKTGGSRRNRRSARSRKAFEPRRIRLEPLEDRRLLSATLQSEWAFLVGGDTRGVALDRDGNVFTVGTFSGAVDFDPGPQVKSLMSLGSDAFVAKYSPSGALLWVTGFGSPSQDIAFGVAVNEFVDDFGNEFVNVYATGTFWETVDFDPLNEHPLDPSTGLPSDTLTSAGDRDVFFLKLNGDDGSFQWVRRAGGTGYDQPMASLAVDKLGNIYGTGFVSSEVADFGDHDIYTAPTDSWLATNCYVTKLDPAGTFSWASNYEIVDQGGLRRGRIAVDDRLDDATQWSVVTTGGFGGTVDFGKDEQGQDVIGTASNPTDQEWALFVLKLNPETGRVRSLLQTDVAELMHGVEVAVDESGNVLIAGQFAGSADFNPAPDQDSILQSVGGADAFVLKLDRDGNFGFAKRFGGVGDDMAYALAIDPLGNIYLSGWFSETADLDPDPAGDFLMTSRGGRDIFVVKLDPTGTFDEARRAGGADSDSGVGIVADPKQNVYVTGQFFSDAEGDFDSEPAEGHGGGFVWKLSPMRMRVAALSDLTTTESGDSASFDVWLSEPPTADVTITLHSSDTSEGTVSPTALLFTPGNYSTPQRVTVTGVDDPDRDGNVAYTIAFDPASSLDANFHGTQARAVVVTNVDSETITETFLNDTPMAIADAKGKNSSLTTSQLTIPAHGTIVDLNVRLDIRHRLSDLSVYLVSPDGTQVELFSGLAGNDFIGTLDDEASFPVTNIVSPRNDYQPEELLSAFDSKEFSGTWTLKIYDSDRLGTGALNSWSLTAVYVPPAPEISIADRTVTEGDDGTVEAVFTLTRSGDTSGEVSVNLATADGSATTAGSDYVAASGTVTFAPGQTTATISVIVNGDTAEEGNETFFVNLSGATGGATIGDGQAVGTILDDDATVVPVTYSNTTTVAIYDPQPKKGTLRPAVSQITIPADHIGDIIGSLNVDVNIAHALAVNLQVTLTGGGLSNVPLVYSNGAWGLDSPTPFDGQQLGGTWTLTVTDLTADGVTGTLNGWSMTVTPAAGAMAASADASSDDLLAILAADQTAREHGKSLAGKKTGELTDLALLELHWAQ